MYLKRIELSGFKSFADRTELEFGQGITAVVGPNGSGKSNISDAIRWVLGEQSAKSLRGGKMEDIIFAGSDGRKPVNVAEVSLTLDNGDQELPLDYSEVTVTRRVHRSGESEYFINKQACRLKDITELFMDTGIGKEAYSIIGQGRIEEILSTKSEDRRGIFEEASGIVKYKTRKKEAQKKLEETEHNLLRIRDLIAELEDSLEPLRLQSEKAQEYKRLKEELKQGEVALYVHQISRLYETWQKENERRNELEARRDELRAVLSVHDAELEKLRLDVRKIEDEMEELQRELLRLSEETEKCEGHGEVLKERERHLQQNRARLEQAIAALEERRRNEAADVEALKGQVREAAERVRALEAALAEEESRMTEVSARSAADEEERLKGDLLELLNRIAQHRNEMRYVEQQAEAAARRAAKLDEESGHLQAERQRLAEEAATLAAERDRIAQALEKARNEAVRAAERIRHSQEALSELEALRRKWQQRLDAVVSRRDTLQEMKDDYDGFAHGVRAVLKAKGKTLHGVHGAVAELVTVPAKYEIAIETAMGGALQHIVVDDEARAREAIAYLKQRQQGRATFLPLDVIRGRSIPESERRQMEAEAGFVGVAVDLVEFAPRYREIMHSLLGAVVVAETLEKANRIAARGQYRYRVVTLDGDVVNPGGSMTGGSLQKKTSSLLGRQRQIDELGKEIEAARGQLEAAAAQADEQKRLIQAETERLESLRAEGERLRLEEQQTLSALSVNESAVRALDEQEAVVRAERADAEQELAQMSARKEEITAALAQLAADETNVRESIRQAEESRKALESEKDRLHEELTRRKVEAASAASELQALQDRLRRAESGLDLLTQEWQAQQDQLRQVIEELETNRKESVLQVELMNSLRLQKQQCAETLEIKRAERADRLRHIEAEESKTKEERDQLRETEEQLRAAEVRVNRLDVELEGLLRKLGEEYELSFELAKERYPEPEDVLGTEQRVRDLKRRIAALGEVNLGAIEEYRRISERYEFLSRQRDDLSEAKKTLDQVIEDMNAEMSRRFTSTFAEIRKHFTLVFSRLFGGGRADLTLTEPDQPLESGIDIAAQPPGKKLQNLSLLSGGERALTAIALLFAILHVKPVPFCVLDEVEAALDEANVTRFAEYLREFSQTTQFIVVTHRKGTMEEADVLYGVTMEEGGVSKLVSVRLEDMDEAVSA